MATKKKPRKPMKSKPPAGKKRTPKKKPSPKKALLKAKTGAKKKTSIRKPLRARGKARPKKVRGKRQDIETVDSPLAGTRARSGGQSGSLQGLSDVAGADSESVDELIEEGNAFEAEVVQGVEDAPDPDEDEVHTHEVPEDDVPGEYDEGEGG